MSTLLTGATVWDGLADSGSGVRDVLVDGGRIAAIAEHLTAPVGAEEIDLRGHTLSPGFIDCHTHVAYTPDVISALRLSPPALCFRAFGPLHDLLMNGFTTVRDLSGPDPGFSLVDLREAVVAGVVVGPRMLVAPHMVSARGGHGDGSGMLADIFQGSHRILEFAAADGCDEIRTRVRQEIRGGADWIKFAATGGFSSPSDDPEQTTYSQEEMNTLVATAADLGLPATPHCYGDLGIQRAVLAGVRSIEHGNLATPKSLRMMEDHGTYLVPTQFTIIDDARHAFDDEYWVGKPDFKRRKFQRLQKTVLDAAEHLAASEVKIAYGTDAGMFPHSENWREFPMMVANGIKPARALRAATSVAAEMLGLDDLGTLAVGKIADIIAMPGDPFTDIDVTGAVDFVMKAGVIHRRPTESLIGDTA